MQEKQPNLSLEPVVELPYHQTYLQLFTNKAIDMKKVRALIGLYKDLLSPDQTLFEQQSDANKILISQIIVHLEQVLDLEC